MTNLFDKKAHAEKKYGKRVKPYHLTDNEMLWFALNAKYCGLCIRRREPWDASERDLRIIEWSKGLITAENIEGIKASYQVYVDSDRMSDQTFEYKAVLKGIIK